MCQVNPPVENISMQNIKIKCDNCEFDFPQEQIQSHIKEKHAVRCVLDSILCLTEGIARLEDLVVDKFEKLNTEENRGESRECSKGETDSDVITLKHEIAKVQADRFLETSKLELKIKELKKQIERDIQKGNISQVKK